MDFAFTQEERAIFQYHDGSAQRFGDPLEMERRVRFTVGDIQSLISKVNVDLNKADALGIKQALQAQEQLTLAVRTAFEMKDFDAATGKGATEAMVLAVWRRFCDFLAQKKTAPALSPTSSTPSPASPELAASSPNGSATATSLASS